MKPQYLVRFDDICPGMNWAIWLKIEQICLKYNLTPLLAVVPDNRCAALNVQPPVSEEFFWDKVRYWQEKGWPIALHGYQHLYESNSSGLLGLNEFSEFAGFPENAQEEKIRKAVEIFENQKVKIDLWIAPGHSFDNTTLKILKKFGIKTISDGFYLYPFKDKAGFFWIPQQLWNFRNFPWGIWTVCFHHNTWTQEDLKSFESNVQQYPMINYWNLNLYCSPIRKFQNFIFNMSYRALRILRNKLNNRKSG